MKIRYLMYAILFILLLSNLMLIVNFRTLKKNNIETNDELKKAKDWNLKQDIIRLNKVYEDKSEDMLLPQFFLLDTTSNYYFINQKLASQKYLILYISESNCEDCIRHALAILKDNIQQIGEQNVVILTNYINQRHYQAFQNTLDIPVISYNINGQSLNLPVEVLHKPFFFILDTDLYCRQLFVPIKEIDGYTASYLKNISNRYWKTKNESNNQNKEKS